MLTSVREMYEVLRYLGMTNVSPVFVVITMSGLLPAGYAPGFQKNHVFGAPNS